MILCGDIGGTKALLAIADDKVTLRFQRRYACADYNDFAPLFNDFLAEARAAGIAPTQLAGGCLAVAGPVEEDGQRARLTNLPWHIDAAELSAQHGCGPLMLINDFAAAAAGIEAISAHDIVTLQTGEPCEHGTRVVVGAGTGLGVATLVWQNAAKDLGGYRILPGEGGHCGFAPANAEQAALWAFLSARTPDGRVTAERVVSGPGLLAIYDFLCSTHGTDGADQPDPRGTADPAAALTQLAATRPDSRARHAVDLFCAAYGAFAGDLAMTLLARGGVYIAGGIAARIPLHVVTDTELGLKGAALLALQHMPDS